MVKWELKHGVLLSLYIFRSLSENREPTAEKPFWPDSTIKFVKYAQYSPHLIGESDSKWFPLATASILGQAPLGCCGINFRLILNFRVRTGYASSCEEKN